MQATPDDGLWKVRKLSGPIQTWNQDIYLESWKDLNKII